MEMNWNQTFEMTMNDLKKSAENFPWEDKAAYTQWLGQTYHFVIHTTRILTLASARTPMQQQQLHNRFIDHSKEERGHENLLINDLKAMSLKTSDFPEFAPTAALYKTQYYTIEHQSTEAFMGWVIMLEAFAANFGPKILKRVTETHGPKASTFWKVHAEEDQDHVEKAWKQISQLPQANQQDTIVNFVQSAHYYMGMLQECQAAAAKYKVAI